MQLIILSILKAMQQFFRPTCARGADRSDASTYPRLVMQEADELYTPILAAVHRLHPKRRTIALSADGPGLVLLLPANPMKQNA